MGRRRRQYGDLGQTSDRIPGQGNIDVASLPSHQLRREARTTKDNRNTGVDALQRVYVESERG